MAKMTPVITIVTGTFNRLDRLRAMLNSIDAAVPYGVEWDAVICDGGSTDGTLAYLRDHPKVTPIEHGELRGAIRAFTDAANAATGTYVLLANDDVTFEPDSITAALVHLEDNPKCGAVAFEDDRPLQGKRGFSIAYHAAIGVNGQHVGVPYAQVGLFRRWLGQACGWWGADDPAMAGARTYGGDNYLSAKIQGLGYSVDAVPGARVRDHVHEDDLRVANASKGDADAAVFYALFPKGPQLKTRPLMDNPQQQKLRVLYLPIYEEGHVTQHRQKRGLRDALSRYCLVDEVDYVAHRHDLERLLMHKLQVWQPDVLLTQLHGADIVTPAMLDNLRAVCGSALVVNWNGDYWPHGLTSPDMLDLLRYVDLQLTVNAGVLDTYAKHNIPAAYWQIGYEDPGSDLPDMPEHDVLFLGNAYSEKRQQLGAVLREFDAGLYGAGWPVSDGECTYDFATGAALYYNCKIAVGDNQFPDAHGFVSNRLFQALAAGAFLLHQYVPGLEELTGLKDGVHYVGWSDFDDLRAKIQYWLNPANNDRRQQIADAGQMDVIIDHSFDARVRELFLDLIPKHARRRKPTNYKVALRYIGPLQRGFGVMGPITRTPYEAGPGAILEVDNRDADQIVAAGGWERV